MSEYISSKERWDRVWGGSVHEKERARWKTWFGLYDEALFGRDHGKFIRCKE